MFAETRGAYLHLLAISIVMEVDRGAVMLLLEDIQVNFFIKSSLVSLGKRIELRVTCSVDISLRSSNNDDPCHHTTFGLGLPKNMRKILFIII